MGKASRVIAIDPGTTQSAYVIMKQDKSLDEFGILQNDDVLEMLAHEDQNNFNDSECVIEMVASYGMPVGQSVFETCVWIGRFMGQLEIIPVSRIYRKEITLNLCNSRAARDGNVRRAILDRYPPTGGGKTPQIGTKKHPGPLYGVSKDVWAALGVALTYYDNKMLETA